MKYKLVIDKNSDEEIIAVVHSPSYLTDEIEKMVNSYSGTDRIIGYANDQITKLELYDVECITVIERKIIAIDKYGKRYILKERLRDLELIMPSYFVRINKSTLANEHRIERFDASFNGSVDAVFKCGYKDYVSRRCFKEIRERYKSL